MVVDDSAAMRRILTTALGKEPRIEVVGTASNGLEALERLDALSPDVVTLDVEMPGQDGLTTLVELRRRRPRLPVIMISSLTHRGTSTTLDALGRGANDYVAKPVTNEPFALSRFSEELLARVLKLGGRAAELRPAPRPTRSTLLAASGPERARLLAIAASTGGLDPILKVLGAVPQPFVVPVCIVQHLPKDFTALFVDRVSHRLRCPVLEPADGQVLERGTVYIAPGDRHLGVALLRGSLHARLTDTAPENSVRPAADVLFRTGAEACGGGLLAMVLSGIGHDGRLGAQAVRRHGGTVIVQDEESCAAWGMPGSVAEAGLANAVLTPSELAAAITARFCTPGLAT